MWLISKHILSSTIQPYAHFKTAKQLTSNGCRRCEECGDMQIEIIPFSMQI